MFKEIKVNAAFGERTGYQVHASRFFPKLDSLLREHSKKGLSGDGEVHISLLDTVTASHVPQERQPAPSILYNVWESTEQPVEFMKRITLYDQLWVPSEWQRACSIAQGVPEEMVKVVPEGVDPDVYKPFFDEASSPPPGLAHHRPEVFDFVHVGQWQPRKSTREICEAFLKAFPDNENVRLYLSVDTLFPSDEHKTTEERLKAHGLEDSRIIVVHYEERNSYVRRLQAAHCFVTCARSEGWNLPLIEAIACGVPCIAADFGGSTEYTGDITLVRVPELRKPHGIYGNWDVPGMWGEPDYDHLVEQMRHIYNNYPVCKEKALIASGRIRKEFSWDKAAEKAFAHLEELSVKHKAVVKEVEEISAEEAIRAFARVRGYEVDLRRRSAVFVINSHPDTTEKLDTLKETIQQVRAACSHPIMLVTHYPLPQDVIESADYFVYEKEDIMSGEDRAVYTRTKADGTVESKVANKQYHAVAHNNSLHAAVNMAKALGFEWTYIMGYDTEVDLKAWLTLVQASTKPMICKTWEGGEGSIDGSIWAGKTQLFCQIYPRLKSWEEYAQLAGADKFCGERWFYRHMASIVNMDEAIDWVKFDSGNRFDQVDRELWPDEEFITHFIEGPYINVVGISERQYTVSFIDGDKQVYNTELMPGMWAKPSIKYYRPWKIQAHLNGELKYEHILDLKGKKVLISMGSKALGDTIAWMPYLDEFRKKHECHVIAAGWWQEVFDYPEIEFVKPGSTLESIYASYDVGCFDDQLDRNVENWRTVPLQKVASDILGLDYVPLRPKLKFRPHQKGNGGAKKPYICFSEFSTMQNKMWNRKGAWQEVIDFLVSSGYDCVSVSAEPTELKKVIKHNGQSIQQTGADIAGCEFYVGLNHGPAWIAYALGKPVVMITGVSEEWNDFENPYRIAINNEVCGIGCFNDPSLPINRDWHWCPRNKEYACTAKIKPSMVIKTIKQLRGDHAVKEGIVRQNSQFEHQQVGA